MLSLVRWQLSFQTLNSRDMGSILNCDAPCDSFGIQWAITGKQFW